MAKQTDLQFDGWTVNRVSGELAHGEKTSRLPPQPLRILVELYDRAGEVVTREQLVKLLWPEGVVDFDNGLNVAVRRLRVALDDVSDTPRYIETLPRVGYRFIGTVGVPATAPTSAPAPVENRRVKRRHMVAMMLAIAAGIGGLVWWQHSPEPPQAAATAEPRRTSNQRAYEFYLNGKFHRSRRDTDSTSLAIENFEAALREDPYFADASAALSETYTGAAINQKMPLTDAISRARTAALRAIELDPELASGHSALAVIMMNFDLDYAKAEQEFEIARALDDAYARMWHSYGLLRAYQNRLDDAFKYIGRARELEPTSLLYTGNYANLLYHARRYPEAIELARSLLASQPRFDQMRAVLIRSLVAMGDIKGALEQLPLRFHDLPMMSDDGLVYAHAGRRAEALRQIARLEEHGRRGFGMSYEIAVIHAALGDVQKGCEALARSLTDHSQWVGWMKLDPRMDPLRGQPCFKSVEDRLGSGTGT